jgi:hypothetical protein
MLEVDSKENWTSGSSYSRVPSYFFWAGSTTRRASFLSGYVKLLLNDFASKVSAFFIEECFDAVGDCGFFTEMGGDDYTALSRFFGKRDGSYWVPMSCCLIFKMYMSLLIFSLAD